MREEDPIEVAISLLWKFMTVLRRILDGQKTKESVLSP